MFRPPFFIVAMMSVHQDSKVPIFGKQRLSKMIIHLKYILMWVFLIPQPTSNTFIWDSVIIFLVFVAT